MIEKRNFDWKELNLKLLYRALNWERFSSEFYGFSRSSIVGFLGKFEGGVRIARWIPD